MSTKRERFIKSLLNDKERLEYKEAVANRDAVKGDVEEAEKKYENTPVPETLADVVALFDKIVSFSPNALLHCASFGGKFPRSVTLTASHPIDLEAEAKRMGVNLDNPLFDKVKKRNGVGPEGVGIMNKDQMLIPMLNNMLISICQENNFDAVETAKKILQTVQNLRRETGAI